jgi:hypothetical protein
MNQPLYVQKLEKSIDNYLNNITELQDKLRQEEIALQSCLKELRIYETDQNNTTHKIFATA